MKLLLCSATLLTCVEVLAQSGLSGTMADSSRKALPNMNILLHRSQDSSLIKGALTDQAGYFNLQDIPAGSYFILYTITGYESGYIHAVNLKGGEGTLDIGTTIVQNSLMQLSGVTVVARKPLIEQKSDRMVVNVSNSITSAGSTVLDILEKSPGITVNRQGGTIGMNGKSGVQVMINGKMNYMPQEALVQMLSGMTANNVESIELITTPPAGYDASGNAGYINIILKSNPEEGLNGSYSVTAAGFYGSAPALAADFNFRKRKLNLFGNYSFSRLAQKQFTRNFRRVTYQGKTTESQNESERDPFQRNHNLRLGMDYQASKKTTIGILAAGYDNKWKMDAVNNTYSTVNSIPDTGIIIENDEINYWKHLMGNINLQQTIDPSSAISINADYLYYDNNNPVNYFNRFYDGNGQPLSDQAARSSKHTVIRILPVQADYSKQFSAALSFEAGFKFVLSRFTNDIIIENQQQNDWIADPELTGNYLLREQISAGYISAGFIANEKNSFKGGVRYEHTYSNLGSETTKDIVDRKYGNLFPTVYWSHKFNPANSMNLAYNRRINRPTFRDLAPFLIFMDPNTFISGNVALQPSIADAVKFDYIRKGKVFSLAYTYEAQSIASFQTDINVWSNKQYITAQNLVYTQSINASFSIPLRLAAWWLAQLNLVATWQEAKADYLQQPVTVSQLNYNLSGFQSFRLPANFGIELSGFFQSPALFGISKSKSFGALNIGLQKKLSNGASSLQLGVDDIFSTVRYAWVTDIPAEAFFTSSRLQMTRRLIKLSFSRNFGNKMLRNNRMRITASEDERKRV